MSTTEISRPRQRQAARRTLRLPKVKERTGLKHSAIYEGIADGTFPKPVPIGLRAVGWLEDEIEAWIEERIAARDRKSAEARS
jgi:prophage regulatory protein